MAEFDLLKQPNNETTNPVLREMFLRSQDLIKVYNPTEYDHVVPWNIARPGGTIWVIPHRKRVLDDRYGAGYRVVPHYIALRYLESMTEKLLNEMIVQEINSENDSRMRSGRPRLERSENYVQDRRQIEDRIRVENSNLKEKVKELIKFELHEEFGAELTTEVNEYDPTKRIDLSQVFERVENRSESPQEEIKLMEDPVFSGKSVFELAKIARGMGIPTEKTDTKQQLMEKMARVDPAATSNEDYAKELSE